MLGSDVLEVAIGLSFIFLSVSLVATAARESLEGILKMRAMDLERGIREMFNDPDGSTMVKTFFDHPLIASLFAGSYNPDNLKKSVALLQSADMMHVRLSKRRNLPSYVPPSSFSAAVIDILARGAVPNWPYPSAQGGPLSIPQLRAAAATLPNAKLQRAVLSCIDRAYGDVEQLKKNLEEWFNATMDRVSGWYKRRTQLILFLIGLVFAAGMNIDAIYITDRLAQDNALRRAIVAQAEAVAPAGATAEANAAKLAEMQKAGFDSLRGQLQNLGLPIGWTPMPQKQDCKQGPCKPGEVGGFGLLVLVGWLVTAFAVMLGAPFWFDTLSRLTTIRSARKPEESVQPIPAPAPAPSPSDTGSGGGNGSNAAVQTVAQAEAAGFEPEEWKKSPKQKGVI